MLTQLALKDTGGPVLWLIGCLSVVTLALILWKLWQLARLGAWAGAASERAVAQWVAGNAGASRELGARETMRARTVRAAMAARLDARIGYSAAREETERVARRALHEARSGLRALDLIQTIAPLLGLLGTVVGMIAAFQALQATGARADPAALAGGIWQALLTTAAGMGVAIPAGIALAWFESIIDRLEADMEDLATRIFVAPVPGEGAAA